MAETSNSKQDSVNESKKHGNFNFINNIKAFACLSVLAVHFRYNYMFALPKEPMGKKAQLFFSIDYQLFIICVPLFLMATGFLMLNKEFSINYFKKMFQILLLYLLCSLATVAIDTFVFHKSYSLGQVVTGITNFNLIRYAWYVEMYVGLLFFIPILNKAINGVTTKQLGNFVIALVFVIGLPNFVNAVPELNKYIHLANYWTRAYPFVYYFIGAYFRKTFHQPRQRKVIVPTIFLGLMIGLGIFLNMTHANPYVGGTEGGYASIVVIVQSSIVFYFFQCFFNRSHRVINKIASLTLPIYLMSFVVDSNLYTPFIKPFVSTGYMLTTFVQIIVSHFIIAVVLALIINWLTHFLYGIINFLFTSTQSKYFNKPHK